MTKLKMKKIWVYDLYNMVWKKTDISGTITTGSGRNGSGTFYVISKDMECSNKGAADNQQFNSSTYRAWK